MVITGLFVPPNPNFNLLDKIWSSVRKRIAEEYEIQVTGLFSEDPDGNLVICNFYLNCAHIEDDEEKEIYNAKFKECFPFIIKKFEKAITDFFSDIDGYAPYRDYLALCSSVDEPISEDVCNEILNKFLFKKGLKTEEDERKKRKLEKKKEKAKKDLP